MQDHNSLRRSFLFWEEYADLHSEILQNGVIYTPPWLADYLTSLLNKVLTNAEVKEFELFDPAAGAGTFVESWLIQDFPQPDVLHVRELMPATHSLLIELCEQLVPPDRIRFEPDAIFSPWPHTHRPLAIIANPPYGIYFSDAPDALQDLRANVRDPRIRNSKIFNDSYLDFLALALDTIVRNPGGGCLVFITNNNFLHTDSFCYFRQYIEEQLPYIQIFDLGGNIRRDETGNVFSVSIGISILVCANLPGLPSCKKLAIAPNHSLLKKKNWVLHHSLSELEEIPSFEYIGWDQATRTYAEEWTALPQLFYSYATGILTGRQKFVLGLSREEVQEKIELVSDGDDTTLLEKYNLDLSKINLDLTLLRDRLSIIDVSSKITECVYRGLDRRYLFYADCILDGPRRDNAGRITPESPAILALKGNRRNGALHCCLATTWPFEKTSLNGRDNAYGFLQSDLIRLFEWGEEANLKFAAYYALLWSSLYEMKLDSLLQTRLPLVPNFSSAEIEELGLFGEQLLEVHTSLPSISTTPETPEVSYNAEDSLFQWDDFTSLLPSDVWDFQIAGIPQLPQICKGKSVPPNISSYLSDFLRLVTVTNQLIAKIDDTVLRLGIL